jgi:alanine racemase
VNRRTVAEIHLGNLISNYRKIKDIAGIRKIIAVVKADAYGHGAVSVANALVNEGVFALGVACISEARELREAGVRSPIIVFFDNENIDSYFKYDLTPVIFEEKAINFFSVAAEKYGKPLDVHIKVDTGMGRVGLLPDTAVAKIVDMSNTRGIRLAGIMSHFSEADLQDRTFAGTQLSVFNGIVQNIKNKGLGILAHIANSAAILSFQDSLLDAVRPGLMLYGYSPFGRGEGLLPVMSIKAHLISLRKVPAGTAVSYGRTFVTRRPSLIGVLSAGYADGFSRHFSNNADVLVRGKKAPVIGRVCMDLTMVDVTEIEDVSVGDEVTLLSSDIRSGLTAEDLSGRAATISYEILTSFGSRAGRTYRAA